MDTTIYDTLKEKLGDAKVKSATGEDVPLIDLVADWEEGVVKTRAANKDLTAQRESWEQKEKDYKKTVSELSTLKEDLTKKVKDFSGGTDKTFQEREEFQKQINALTDQIKTMSESLTSSQQEILRAKEEAKQANAKASEEGLKKDILTELSEHKITGAQETDFAITTIMAKGLAKIVLDDKGLYSRSFCIRKDGKELAADLKSLCKWVAESNPYLVSSSGKKGTGTNHTSSPDAPSAGNRSYFQMLNNK